LNHLTEGFVWIFSPDNDFFPEFEQD